MDVTIRNVDAETYRRFKAYAAARGQTLGDAFNEVVMRTAVAGIAWGQGKHLWEIEPVTVGKDTVHLSEHIDDILYGQDD